MEHEDYVEVVNLLKATQKYMDVGLYEIMEETASLSLKIDTVIHNKFY